MNIAIATPRIETAPAHAGAVLSVHGLTKSYAEALVLRSLDFHLVRGQATALIGANGSGKSTLLKCLVRLTEPTSGRITLLDRDVCALGPRDLRRLRSEVGIVWQRHNLVPRLSALTNVIHGVQSRMSGPASWFQSIAPASVRQEALSCLDRVGLADRASMRVDSLSGGQQQRVAIARMLMQRPLLILADEPDASLDPQTGEAVMALLLGLARAEGLSLLVISHRLEHTIRFSDRILGLQDGRIALDQPSTNADPTELRRFFDHGGTA